MLDDKKSLGDRMKEYERVEAGRRFMPMLPVMARLDGRAFHTYCKGMERPYDVRMMVAMQNTASKLLGEARALVAYTQSDEITLVWYAEEYKSEIFFGGRIQKMCSILSSLASVFFNQEMKTLYPNRYGTPIFDCRVWQVPTKEEATNAIIWREQDAVRNSIQSAGQAHFSHKQLHKKSQADIQEMLFQEHGINWGEHYPDAFKRGSYFMRRRKLVKFSAEEIEKLPKKHAARTDPDLMVERFILERVSLPIFTKITNRVGVVFGGEEPETTDA